MNPPTIVSFFTRGNDADYYTLHAERLTKECRRMGIPCHIKEVQFNGRPWEQVLKEKPGVLLEALDAVQGPCLWIDVDGSILKRPQFIMDRLEQPDPPDVMAVPKAPERGRPFYMGCVFYNNTEGARWFLREWQQEYATEDSEEFAFGRAYKTVKGMVVFGPLPIHYMRIQSKVKLTQDTVVVHRLSKGDTKMAFYKRKHPQHSPEQY